MPAAANETTALALPFSATRAIIIASRERGMANASDIALINKQARSPLTPEQVYVIPSAISNAQVDAYFTRMTTLSLQNYARDALAGVAFCDSHAHWQMPIGRSFYGEVVNNAGDMETHALAYMIRGMNLPGEMRSDDYITGMEGGIYQDVSISFQPQHYWCTICQLDMLNDWDCMHWPGHIYDTKTGEVQCIADVDATLSEYSLVYDGATPGAQLLKNDDSGRSFSNILLLKADVEVQRGRATAKDLSFVEDRCRVRLMTRYPGYTPPTPTVKDDDMKGSEFIRGFIDEWTRSGKSISKENMDRLTGIADTMQGGHDTMGEAMRAMAGFMDDHRDPADGDGSGDGSGGDSEATTDAGRSQPEAAKPLDAERLTTDERAAIAFAQRAKDEAIELALASGARAVGATFDKDRYRTILVRASYDEIRALEADWDALAKVALSTRGHWEKGKWTTEPTGTGGRQTAARDPNDPAGVAGQRSDRASDKINPKLHKA